jgi:hypothetical protein
LFFPITDEAHRVIVDRKRGHTLSNLSANAFQQRSLADIKGQSTTFMGNFPPIRNVALGLNLGIRSMEA